MCIVERACLDSVAIDHLFFSPYVLGSCTLHCDNSLTNEYLPSGPYRRRATPLWLTTVRVASQEVKKQRGSKTNLLPLQAIISIQAGVVVNCVSLNLCIPIQFFLGYIVSRTEFTSTYCTGIQCLLVKSVVNNVSL